MLKGGQNIPDMLGDFLIRPDMRSPRGARHEAVINVCVITNASNIPGPGRCLFVFHLALGMSPLSNVLCSLLQRYKSDHRLLQGDGALDLVTVVPMQMSHEVGAWTLEPVNARNGIWLRYVEIQNDVFFDCLQTKVGDGNEMKLKAPF